MERALAIVALILLLICVVVIALLAMEKGNDESSKNVTAGKI
jgi:cbb3-type cytochrome oxidase subunit 3